MNSKSTKTISIKKINGFDTLNIDDVLAVEEPLEIRIAYGNSGNRTQKNISVTMRTPGNDHELAIGFLFTEGILKASNDVNNVKHITLDENVVMVELKEHVIPEIQKLERNFYTTSSCGVCGKSSIDSIRTVCEIAPENNDLKVNTKVVCSLPDTLRAEQTVFEHTGGIHASALFSVEGKLLLLKEDVGRHNALDKLIGAALNSELLPLNNHLLLLSGRASFELIQKAAMAGIKIVAAVGAPSSLAVELAKDFNITLIGFLRNQKFNIYCGHERVAN